METKFEQIDELTILIHLQGRIDLESLELFATCIEQLKSVRVIFNLTQLAFVGSNGIGVFLQSIRDLSQTNKFGIKFYGVSSEFKRIIISSEIPNTSIHETLDGAKLAFTSLSVNQSLNYQNQQSVMVGSGESFQRNVNNASQETESLDSQKYNFEFKNQ